MAKFKEEIKTALASPIMQETFAALKGQGFEIPPTEKLLDNVGFNGLAEMGAVDPVLMLVGYVAELEATTRQKIDRDKLPAEVTGAINFFDNIYGDPVQVLPVLIDTGKPWATSMALVTFLSMAQGAMFNSTPNVARANLELADAAFSIIDGLVEKGTWKDVPPKLVDNFTTFVDHMAKDAKGGMGKALSRFNLDLKQAIASGTSQDITAKAAPAAPAAPAPSRKQPEGLSPLV